MELTTSSRPPKRRWWQRNRKRTPEELFLEHRGLIEKVAKAAGRNACFLPQDVDDFVAEVYLKLIKDDYAVLRTYKGDAKLPTYLTTVIQNACRDYRDRLWGKYRPSAPARHLGKTAVALECLLARDGHDLDAAIKLIRERRVVPESDEELWQLAAKLPPRTKRHFVGEEILERSADDEGSTPERRVEDAERSVTAAQVEKVLDEALRVLDAQDLLILKRHYGDGLGLATIAREQHLDQRSLYTRKDRCIRRLLEHLRKKGVTLATVSEVFGWQEIELRTVLTEGTDSDAEIDPASPSHKMGESGGRRT